MFSIFKKKKGPEGPQVPEWASFFSPKQYGLFLSEVEKYFKNKGATATVDDGVVEVEGDAFGGSRLGLVNVAQMCRANDEAHYGAIIADHFEMMVQAQAFESEFSSRQGDFEYAKQYVGVRIYNDNYVGTVGDENVIARKVADDLTALLIFDFPTTVRNLKPDEAAQWDKSHDELFEIGLENIRNNYQSEISREDLGEVGIWLVNADHFFCTNIVLEMARHPQLQGSSGALVIVPHRHAVISFPIDGLEVIQAVNTLIPVVAGMFAEGPGSISDKLYWYHEGNFTTLPYDISDGKLQFMPPQPFVEMLNSMAAE